MAAPVIEIGPGPPTPIAMLKERLQEELKAAMRARDTVRLRTIRSLRAALLEREIAIREGGKGEVSEEQAMAVVQKAAKQRRDALQQYRDAGREDLAKIEAEELEVLDDYLPKQLTDQELRSLVSGIVSKTGASSMKDMGRVMGAAMGQTKGKADGKRVQAVVRTLLAG
jgi:uncharacterized protein